MSDGSLADTAGQGCNCEAVGTSLGAALVSNSAVICVGGEAHPLEGSVVAPADICSAVHDWDSWCCEFMGPLLLPLFGCLVAGCVGVAK
jgi:hypothetical protein